MAGENDGCPACASGTRFVLLGPLAVRHGTTALPISGVKPQVLLATLLLHAGETVSAGRLTGILWDGKPPVSARAALQNHVMRLRRALGDCLARRLRTMTAGYRIDVGAGELDLQEFGELRERGRRHAARREWAQAAAVLGDAMSLWTSQPLGGLDAPALSASEVPRLVELGLQTLEWRLDADLQLGRHGDVIAELMGLCGGHPLRERFAAQLMLALFRSGRQAEALAVYQAARRRLVAELGVEPGRELRDLHQRILRSDPALAPGADSPARRGPEARGTPGTSAGEPPRDGPRPPAVPQQLPAAVRHFVGRGAEWAALTGLLAQVGAPSAAGSPGSGGTVVIAAIAGSAGIGKTTLAVRWAHHVAGGFPDGQLYANLRGFGPAGPPMKPAQAIRGFLVALGLPARSIPADPAAQASLYRSLLVGKRVLILLDNARTTAQVRPLMPASPGCLVLVTSRNQLTGLVAGYGAHAITLDVLSGEEAHEMLARRLAPQQIPASPAAIRELARLCARLPLALSVAAARAATSPGLPLEALATELRDAKTRLDALDGGDTTNVRAVLSWSYQHLSKPAARMFRLLAVHPGPDITAGAAASLAAVTHPGARRALAELTNATLISEYRPGRFAFHDLLRAYAAEQARHCDSPAAHAAARRRVIDHYLHAADAADRLLHPGRDRIALPSPHPGTSPEPPASAQQAMAWLAAEHQVLLAVCGLAAATRSAPQAWQLPWALVTHLDRRGHWHDFASTQRSALAAAQAAGDRAGQAHAHRDLGRAYGRLGSYADAQAHLRRGLGLFGELGDAAGQAQAHLGIGRTFESQGRYASALTHAEQALRLFRHAGHDAGQANALNAAGWTHAHLGDLGGALTCCQQALNAYRALGDRAGVAQTWDSLGLVYHRLGDYPQAGACYQEAVQLCEDLGDRYNQAGTLARLSDTQAAMRSTDAARQSLRRALTILDDLRHPDAARVRARLARLG